MENNNINYGKAMLSVAIIDFDMYIEVLNTVELKLSEPLFVLERVLARKKKDEEMCYVLQRFSFPEFAKAQKYIKYVKKNITKHQNKLKDYFLENPTAEQEFNNKLNQLLPLLEEKEQFVEKQIEKCFEYLNSFNVGVSQ